ncbi:hypothetical protein [Sporosarcina pasteurii]|uniref:YtkA-like domain-containing protein n=1 Tax=Sporosarcina pasteurii TaxID=1474 RepID=A0A380C6L4_SPOPA|nr:hypothetical protein [Sporosarcina pasteurii]MDS9473054.1 hypothetical protein [Sporosarcina pasteurii]SUJ14171.1 Uncharacterised protein [Sporosarcina pasteurii]
MNVRYEIWYEDNSDEHDWVDAKEEKAGEYTALYTFEEAEQYTIIIHVEDEEDLHEHEEHIVDVKL